MKISWKCLNRTFDASYVLPCFLIISPYTHLLLLLSPIGSKWQEGRRCQGIKEDGTVKSLSIYSHMFIFSVVGFMRRSKITPVSNCPHICT